MKAIAILLIAVFVTACNPNPYTKNHWSAVSGAAGVVVGAPHK